MKNKSNSLPQIFCLSVWRYVPYLSCVQETGYKGEGRRREAWWHQEASEKQLWDTLVDSR